MSQTKAQLVGGVGISTAENITVGSAVTANSSGIVVTGIVTATSFVGDGSNLSNTGSTLSAASGSQRVVVTSQTSGTMTASATDGDLTFDAGSNTLNTSNLSVTGITTLGSSNGIGTVTIGVGATALLVQGSARVTGILTVGEGSVTINGINNSATVPGTITGGTGCITGTMTAATGCVPGTLTAGTATVPGTLTGGTGCVTGTLTAATGCVPGTITAGNAAVPGTVTTGTGCVTGTLTAANANIPGTVTAGTFSGSGSGLSNIPSGAITGGISAAEVCTFTSSGTWTKPTSAKFVMVEILSAGGGGGAESTNFPAGCCGGGGGGGGGFGSFTFRAPELSPTVPVIVGSGGVGGLLLSINPSAPCPSAYRCGTDGGNSCFGSTFVYGGGAGSGYFRGKGSSITLAGDITPNATPTGDFSTTFGVISCNPTTRSTRNTSICGGGGGGVTLSPPVCIPAPFAPCKTSTNASETLCYMAALTGGNSFFGAGGGGGGAGRIYNPGAGCYAGDGSGGAGGISGCGYNVSVCCSTSVCGAWGGCTRNPSVNGCPAISQFPSECRYGGGGGAVNGTGGNGNLGGGGGGAGWNGPQGGSGGNGRVVVYTWS